MKKTTNVIIAGICILLLALLLIITFQAITFRENWTYSLDFGEDIIGGYASLAGGIISLLSAILLIYTIFTQLSQFKHQDVQFKEQLKLQIDQFKEGIRQQEYQDKKDLYFKLKLIDVFLISIISHLKTTAEQVHLFLEKEKEEPLAANLLFFPVDKNMDRLNDMDYISVFKAFQEFFGAEDEMWIKRFNDLFSLVNFYNDATEELRSNVKYHIKDKYERKKKIADSTQKALNNCLEIVEKYKNELGEGYLNHPYCSLINDFIPAYYKLLEEDIEENSETNLDKLSQLIFLPFLENIMRVRAQIGFEEYGVEGLVSSISTIRKEIYGLKYDIQYFTENLEERFNSFYSSESKGMKDILEIKSFIHSKTSQLDVNNL